MYSFYIEQTFKEIHTITLYNRDSEESISTYVNLYSFPVNKGTYTCSVHLAESDAKFIFLHIF